MRKQQKLESVMKEIEIIIEEKNRIYYKNRKMRKKIDKIRSRNE